MRLFLPLAALAALTGATAVAAESDGAAEEAHLVPMEELAVPIVDGGRSTGTLRVKLVLDMADAAAAAGATLPPLRAASLGAAMEHARLYASPMAPVNAERLAADMTAALRAADTRVSRVLIVEVGATRA